MRNFRKKEIKNKLKLIAKEEDVKIEDSMSVIPKTGEESVSGDLLEMIKDVILMVH